MLSPIELNPSSNEIVAPSSSRILSYSSTNEPTSKSNTVPAEVSSSSVIIWLPASPSEPTVELITILPAPLIATVPDSNSIPSLYDDVCSNAKNSVPL